MAIKNEYLIEKRNLLNEMRSSNMSLQELRFFTIYLSKINARDISTRIVRFAMSDFQKIMEMGKLNMTQLRRTTNSLLSKVVNVPTETGGYKAFQIFKLCHVDKDINNEWYIEIDAHDESLPLMFDFKDRYFTYSLWNALRLKSINQLRMYELLKQYEKIGERTVSLVDLKEFLGMKKSDYPRYNSFRADVLEVCREAVGHYTDIKFVYAPTGKLGKGGKVLTLKFKISRNDDYADPISLADFIDLSDTQIVVPNTDDFIETVFVSERLEFLSGACENEFNEAEMQVLYNAILDIIPHVTGESFQEFRIKVYDYLKRRYDELNMRAGRTRITSRFGYLKKMLEGSLQQNS